MNIEKYEKLSELDKYFRDIKDYIPLTCDEEKRLSEEIKNGSETALEKLVTSNLKFVVSIAKAYRKYGVPFSDLISEGNVGLIRAAKKFDGTKNIRFISYAVWWIKNSLQECVEQYNKNHKEYNCLDEGMINSNASREYRERTINNEFENEMADLQSRKATISELMKCLKKREIKILIEYYGLGDSKEKTLDEISEEMNISNERVRQIKDKALIKLRTEALMSNEFNMYKSLR